MAAKQIRASNVAFQSHKPAFSPPTLKDITVSEWRQQCIIGVQKGIVGLFAFVVGSLKEYCDVHSVVSGITGNKRETSNDDTGTVKR